MALHELYWPELQRAIAGEKVHPRGLVKGSLNYKHMTVAASVIVDPTPEHCAQWLELLDSQREHGHQTRIGPEGVACEQGVYSMHGSFYLGSVAGVLLKGPRRLAASCCQWLIDQGTMRASFSWCGRQCQPCPRLEDQKHQAPSDGYIDTALKLFKGEKVKRGPDYWATTQATGVRTLRDALAANSEVVRGIGARLSGPNPRPKLYLPIERRELEGGGYEAWIEDTSEARAAMGEDACHRVRIGPEGLQWQVDWIDEWLPRRAA